MLLALSKKGGGRWEVLVRRWGRLKQQHMPNSAGISEQPIVVIYGTIYSESQKMTPVIWTVPPSSMIIRVV